MKFLNQEEQLFQTCIYHKLQIYTHIHVLSEEMLWKERKDESCINQTMWASHNKVVGNLVETPVAVVSSRIMTLGGS